MGTNSNGDKLVRYLEGDYVENGLQGVGRVGFENGSYLITTFQDGGFIQGPGLLYSKGGDLLQAAWYYRNVPVGLVWRFLRGGSCLVGRSDGSWSALSGDHIAFLYPDLRTALVGTFIEGRLTLAQTCFVSSVTIRKVDNLAFLTFTDPRGPFYTYDPGNATSLCQEPLLPDPYESQNVQIRTSKLKAGGEGLFALRHLPKDVFVSFYNGLRLTTDGIDSTEDSKADWRGNAYKIMDLMGPDERGVEGVIDIPLEMTSAKKYRASLAHKTNHSFTPNCRFALFDHPRFGPVPSVQTVADVAPGEELTVSYDYDMDEAPPWYQELFIQRIMDSYKKSKSNF